MTAADPKKKLDTLVAAAVEVETDLDRHDMEAAVLATVARHGLDSVELWHGAADLTWSRADHGAIYTALADCLIEKTTPDLILIRDRLKDKKIEDAVLAGILDGSKAKDLSVAVRYLDIMSRQDRLRRAEEAGRDYLSAVERAKTEGRDVDAAIAGLLKDAFELAHRKKLIREYPTEADAAADFLDTLNARRTDGRAYLGLDTGFRHLNEVLNGLTEGVFILAGAPSTGKTTLAKQIADQVAITERVPVLFWSFEQSAEELRIKSLARIADVDSRTIWKGRENADTWTKVEEAADTYRRGTGRWLTIIEAGREDNLDRIRSAAVLAKHKAGGDRPILLVLDYLQILPALPGSPDNLRERIDQNLSELRRLSRDLKSPIVVVSSQNREAYRGNDKTSLAALKESGGIEYSADVVCCLWRDKKETENLTQRYNRPMVRVIAYVLKNRNGELAKVDLDFLPAWACFNEGDVEGLDWSAALKG